ncbi:MAG: hypothetical protein AABY22_03180 [Nanoarchaeota archaeon]
MKIIRTFSGYEFVVSDNDAGIIASSFDSGKLVALKTGEIINPKSIELIGDPELIAVWKGYTLDKNMRYFMRDNQKVYLEPKHYEEIKYESHPKYQLIKKILMEKMKMVSDKEKSEVNMEVAREERKLK